MKDIGRRLAYDILHSRKPRATGGDLWVFRFQPVAERAHRLAGRASAGRDVAFAGGLQRRCWPGPELEMVTEAMGGVTGASDIVTESIGLSESGVAKPCRVMARWSRSLR